MSDLRTVYDPATATCDLQLEGGQLAMDAGLETAVLLSLLSDRRAEDTDALPDGGDDRRGWWADAFPEKPGDRIGSRLWLLGRAKDLPATLEQAREYAAEACQWLLDDGIAARIEVAAERLRPGAMSLTIAITRPDRTQINIRFADLWRVS